MAKITLDVPMVTLNPSDELQIWMNVREGMRLVKIRVHLDHIEMVTLTGEQVPLVHSTEPSIQDVKQRR